MFRYVVGLSFLYAALPSALSQTLISQGEIQSALFRAETLYYEAQYKETIQLLAPLDLALQRQSGDVHQRVRVKLQLALAHIGLNETGEARARLAELCGLDPDYDLDPRQYAPKVIALFKEARNDGIRLRCAAVCNEATKLLVTSSAQALLNFIESAPTACSCLQTAKNDAAELFYRQGLDEFKKENFIDAVQYFTRALQLNPEHEMAAKYVEMSQIQLQVAVERWIVDWRKAFDARRYDEATSIYRRLSSPVVATKAAAPLQEIRTEYRRRLSLIAESWKGKSCADRKPALRDSVRADATAMLPDPLLGQDLIEKIDVCSGELVNRASPCLEVPMQVAMERLKSRVAPEVPRNVELRKPTRFVARIQIDTTGKVAVDGVEGPDIVLKTRVRSAVERWKFFPSLGPEPQCIETDIPIVLSPK